MKGENTVTDWYRIPPCLCALLIPCAIEKEKRREENHPRVRAGTRVTTISYNILRNEILHSDYYTRYAHMCVVCV